MMKLKALMSHGWLFLSICPAKAKAAIPWGLATLHKAFFVPWDWVGHCQTRGTGTLHGPLCCRFPCRKWDGAEVTGDWLQDGHQSWDHDGSAGG